MNSQKVGRPSPSNLESAIDQLIKGRELASRLGAALGGQAQINTDRSSAPKELTKELVGTFSKAIAALGGAGANQAEINGNPTVKPAQRGGSRRRSNPGSYSRKVAATLDDGHSWRKYGQKEIYNAKYSRNYFRCRHKFDQGCKATRQVQRSEEDPSMFVITYFGEHTCGDPMEVSSSFPRGEHSCIIDFGSGYRDPTFVLSKREPNEEVVSDHPTPLTSSTTMEACFGLPELEEVVGGKDRSDATSGLAQWSMEYMGWDLTEQSFEFGDFYGLEDDRVF